MGQGRDARCNAARFASLNFKRRRRCCGCWGSEFGFRSSGRGGNEKVRRENDEVIRPREAGRGTARSSRSERRVVEGAWTSELRLRGRTIVSAAAPSTALRAVPFPAIAGQEKKLCVGSAAGDAHVAGERGAPVAAIDDEVVALGLAGDRLVDRGIEQDRCLPRRATACANRRRLPGRDTYKACRCR